MEQVWTLCVLGVGGGGWIGWVRGFGWWMYNIRVDTGIEHMKAFIQDFIKKMVRV